MKEPQGVVPYKVLFMGLYVGVESQDVLRHKVVSCQNSNNGRSLQRKRNQQVR